MGIQYDRDGKTLTVLAHMVVIYLKVCANLRYLKKYVRVCKRAIILFFS